MLRISLTTLAAALLSATAFAQDVDIDLSLEDGLSISTQQWYENPVVWVAGILIILLIVFLSRRTAK